MDTSWTVSSFLEVPRGHTAGPFSTSFWGTAGPEMSIDVPMYLHRYHKKNKMFRHRVDQYRTSGYRFDATCKQWLLSQQQVVASKDPNHVDPWNTPEPNLVEMDTEGSLMEMALSEVAMLTAFHDKAQMDIEFTKDAMTYVNLGLQYMVDNLRKYELGGDASDSDGGSTLDDSSDSSSNDSSSEASLSDQSTGHGPPGLSLEYTHIHQMPSWFEHGVTEQKGLSM
ncbi:hypothetical protein DXG01_003521 [Tephrocybe rancida]|nr:hypothetical protein DXG01_003521 [Tephrocybe rancida]